MADPNVYALQIELSLQTDQVDNSIDELANKMTKLEADISAAAKASMKLISDLVDGVKTGLTDIEDVAANSLLPMMADINTQYNAMNVATGALNAGLQNTAANAQNVTAAFNNAAVAADRTSRNVERTGQNTRDAVGDAASLDDAFDKVGKTFDEFVQQWRVVLSYLNLATRGIDQFRTANFRLSGSMYDLVGAAREIEGIIGDFENSIEIVKSLNAIRVPTDQIAAYGVAISKANVYLGANVEVLVSQTAILMKSGRTAQQVTKFLDNYAQAMAKTGATAEDLNQILADQNLNLQSLAIVYGNLTDESLELAQGFQIAALEAAGMARSFGVSASAVAGDISKAVEPLTQTNLLLRQFAKDGELSGKTVNKAMYDAVRAFYDLDNAAGLTGAELANFNQVQSTVAQQALGISKETVTLQVAIQKYMKSLSHITDEQERFEQALKKAREEIDPFGSSTEELMTQLGKLNRVFAPFIYLLKLASEALTRILIPINYAIDMIIALYEAMTIDDIDKFDKHLTKFGQSVVIVGAFLKSIVDNIKNVGRYFGITDKQMAQMMPTLKFIAGLAVLVAIGFGLMIAAAVSLGSIMLMVFSSLSSLVVGFQLLFAKSANQIAVGASNSISTFLTGLGKGIANFAKLTGKFIVQMLALAAALLIVAAAMYVLALAVQIIAATQGAYISLLLLSAAIIALGIAFVVLGSFAQAAAVGLAIVAVVFLAVALSVSLIILAFALLITTIDSLVNTMIKFVMVIIQSGDVLLGMLPKIGFAFLSMGASLLAGAIMIAAAGAILIAGSGLLILGSAGLLYASVAFTAANAAFGYAIGGFEERATSLFAGASMLNASAEMINQGSLMIQSSVNVLSGITDASDSLEEAIDGIMSSIGMLRGVGQDLLISSLVFSVASQFLAGAFSGIVYAFANFKSAADMSSTSAKVFDGAIDILNTTTDKIQGLNVNLHTGLVGLGSSVYRLFGISVIFTGGSIVLGVAAVAFEFAVSTIFNSSRYLMLSSVYIGVAGNHLGHASGKLRSITKELADVVNPLLSTSSSITTASLRLGLAALAFVPASYQLASGSQNLDRFSSSVSRFVAVDTAGFANSAINIKGAMNELSALDTSSLVAVANAMNMGADALEKPIDRMIDLLGRLRDSLTSLSQEISLDSSIGRLADDVSRYATVVENAATRIESAIVARAVPAMDEADRSRVREAIRASTIGAVTINTESVGSADVKEQALDVNKQILSTLLSILQSVDAKEGNSQVKNIFDLLSIYLPELKSSGGNLSSEFNNWG